MGYLYQTRYDITNLLPDGKVVRSLEIGCGTGLTSAWIHQKYHCWTTGIELNETAAEDAGKRLDQVIVADIQTFDLDLGPFDLVLCLDVLEHLRNPDVVMRKMASVLSDEGCIIASIPNLQHFSVSMNLLRGKWEYSDNGLLDRTHATFFVKQSILKLFHDNGLYIEQLESNMGKVPRLLNAITVGMFDGLLSYQYLVRASAKPR